MASDKMMNFAGIAQALKHQIRSGSAWGDLTPAAKESLDQIATSIARTVSGDGAHWDGIIGFAQAARPTTEFGQQASTLVGQHASTLLSQQTATVEIERGIRQMVREIPTRNDVNA